MSRHIATLAAISISFAVGQSSVSSADPRDTYIQLDCTSARIIRPPLGQPGAVTSYPEQVLQNIHDLHGGSVGQICVAYYGLPATTRVWCHARDNDGDGWCDLSQGTGECGGG